MDTIQGFGIEKRDLTPEEASREITVERFNTFHQQVGENFLDGYGGDNNNINFQNFAGFMMAKRPDLAPQILEVVNDKYGEMLGLEQIIEDSYDQEDGWEKPYNEFYTYLCEYLNLTTGTKRRINQVLILVNEHYGNK